MTLRNLENWRLPFFLGDSIHITYKRLDNLLVKASSVLKEVQYLGETCSNWCETGNLRDGIYFFFSKNQDIQVMGIKFNERFKD